MQNFRPGSVGKLCLALLGLTLFTQSVLGYEDNKISYLDSVSSSYINNSQDMNEQNILDMNSIDARAIETTLKLDSSPVITNSDLKVNLSLRDSDIKQVLRMLADKAKLNIVFDKSVSGKVTLDLNNVTLNDAFMVIFKSTQLTYFMEGNTITVATIEAAKDMAYTRKNVTMIPIKYVNSEQVAEFLNENLFKSNIFGLSNKPIVTSNPRTNQIIVFGTAADVAAVKRMLPTLDTKPMINSFKVNHTTPKEMAVLICNSLFYDVKTNDDDEDEDDDDEITLGTGYVACRDQVENAQAPGGNNTSLATFKASPLTITYFPELGKITAYGGSVEQVSIIKDFIKEHDKKQMMAYVEISVIELNDKGSKEFSNAWNLHSPFISLGLDPNSGLTIGSATAPFTWGHNNMSNSRVLETTLKYALENGNGRTLTNPKIMVTNGKKTTIDMTSDYVKTTTSQILQSSSSVTSGTQKTVEVGSDEGILIELVPFISPDGYVSMNITPEFATIKGKHEEKNPQTGEWDLLATLLQRRDLELKNVRIRDGETLILAGLIKDNETQTIKKVPLLGDMPFFGVFFRNTTSEKAKEEIVIVITPHIIKDSDDISQYDNTYDL